MSLRATHPQPSINEHEPSVNENDNVRVDSVDFSEEKSPTIEKDQSTENSIHKSNSEKDVPQGNISENIIPNENNSSSMSDNHSIISNKSIISSKSTTNSNDVKISASQNIHSEALEKCRTKHSRLSREKPPWFNNASPNIFKKVIVVKELHSARKRI